MHNHLKRILEEKGDTVHSVEPETTVLDAVRRMNQHRVGALLVMDGERPVGIFTERDVLQRVVDAGKDPGKTQVAEVMTTDLVCVRPETTVHEAMAVITERRCRHLPVLDGKQLAGLVSIGDLTRWLVKDQHVQIRDLVDFITGKYPR
jgi:CBS domain-containing protein